MAEDDPDLDLARQGDREAFGRLVHRHQRRVYAAALHITGNHGDADDVTQDTFVRAYRALASFDGRADLSTWLYRIAVNTALNTLRTDRRGAQLVQQGAAQSSHVGGRPEALGSRVLSPAERTQQAHEVTRTLEAVAQLSAALRVTIVLAAVEELPYKTIAEILEIPEGTVAWRVNEARRILREKLTPTERIDPAALVGTPVTVK